MSGINNKLKNVEAIAINASLVKANTTNPEFQGSVSMTPLSMDNVLDCNINANFNRPVHCKSDLVVS